MYHIIIIRFPRYQYFLILMFIACISRYRKADNMRRSCFLGTSRCSLHVPETQRRRDSVVLGRFQTPNQWHQLASRWDCGVCSCMQLYNRLLITSRQWHQCRCRTKRKKICWKLKWLYCSSHRKAQSKTFRRVLMIKYLQRSVSQRSGASLNQSHDLQNMNVKGEKLRWIFCRQWPGPRRVLLLRF